MENKNVFVLYIGGGYGGLSAPKFRGKRRGTNDSDSDDGKISPWDARRSSVVAGNLPTTDHQDDMRARRKSVFDESSSDEDDDGFGNGGRRLTVDISNAKNDAVSGNMGNLNKYQ